MRKEEKEAKRNEAIDCGCFGDPVHSRRREEH